MTGEAVEKVVFADCGLHLAVMNSLLELKLLRADTLKEVLQPLTSTFPDGEELYDVALEEEGQRVRAALELLHKVALPLKDVRRIRQLTFDGGNPIYMLIEDELHIDSGGEADYYLVADFEGIDQLTSLQSVMVDSYSHDADTSALERHPNDLQHQEWKWAVPR